MFRVVYEWHVPVEKMDEFQNVWRSATESIHHSVEGALGSVMLRSYDTPEKVLTIAKWYTREDWELFWGNRNPEKMQQMRKIAKRVSVEAFDEIEDRTK
ncbi:antibiotic biosynthesis monooxygenase family protein [Vibrio parahaemolyticus]|uniref:antibiotic biosynthesis monooxygenase family protein n=1 Tax=Vibrio parahaemolyticus TaxID=670 RepID=UPI0004D34A19|nr:antibiotic biosynthesis monooxygenase [Vibrio parahaemolyticus]EHK1074893.1 antibiotic biosynthesis monooxygenase [Vibrio parahaemolyticus]EII2981629.1 antibiotic biosynthesis monooxygenase [Vibrio parahaemolyticus]EJB8440654.1 antibiotic biosynthesis monooxygenase [Vibrio parahaemolyticus]EJG0621174.1 antibiotic biosynthesis monooxygenase [Vibrio parahaemolyticus]EJG0639823.1 antibiotic biosynthesis monooxygenase [Vibrio parahaemolyticus]